MERARADEAVASAAESPLAAHPDLVRQVQAALHHLHDPAYLRTLPLARGLASQEAANGRETPGEHPGRLLRQRIEAAIAALEADLVSAQPEQARGARLLRLRYVEAQDAAAVQRELGISRAQFYRDRARATDALIALVVPEWLPEAPARTTKALNGATLSAQSAASDQGKKQALQSQAAEGASAGAHVGTRHPQLGIGAALVLITIAWGGAWYLVWSFAQAVPWLAAWTIGGAISGFSTGAILRLAFPAITWRQAVFVALGWVEAWAIAWLLGSNLAGFAGWAFRQEVLASTDPSSLTFGIGRGTAWAAGGLLMARIVRREGWRGGWAAAAVLALGWAAAGGIGHALFWVLSPARFAPGIRFAISGLVEGAIGGAFTLSPITRASHGYVAGRPGPARPRPLDRSTPWLRALWPATRRGPSLREREGGVTGSG